MLHLKSQGPIPFIHGNLHYDMQLFPQSIYGLVGPNGIGKSSFVHYLQQNQQSFSQRTFGFLQQGPLAPLGELRGVDLLSMMKGLYPKRVKYEDLEDYPLVKQLDFQDKLWRPITQLSGGENQKLKLLALFYYKAEVLVLDEPGNHLDKKTLEFLMELLKDKKERGEFRQMVIIDHHGPLLKSLCEEVYAMDWWQEGHLRIVKSKKGGQENG